MTNIETSSKNQSLPFRFRMLGIIPLILFIVRAVTYYQVGTVEHIQWSCHISNLLLVVGVFWFNPLLIRIASFWLIIGLLPWIYSMVDIGVYDPVSMLTHLGGFIAAITGLRLVGMNRFSWVPALIYFLVLQQISHFTTPVEQNVNVAHFAYGPARYWFHNYLVYWIANAMVMALMLIIIEVVTLKLRPAEALAEAKLS